MFVKSTIATLVAAGTMLLTSIQFPEPAQNTASGQSSANQSSSPSRRAISGPARTWNVGPGGIALPSSSSSRYNSFFDRSANSEQRQAEQMIVETAKSLRQAESSEEREAAEEKLRGLLAADYDDRMKEYAEYLDELEQKLKEMQTKLQRRRDAKQDMIDLKIKVLLAEAEDLGWPARMNQDRFPADLAAPLGIR